MHALFNTIEITSGCMYFYIANRLEVAEAVTSNVKKSLKLWIWSWKVGYGCRPTRVQRINSQTKPFWYRIRNRKTKSIKVDIVNMKLVKVEYAQTLFSISYKRMIRSFEYYNVLNFSRLSINIFFKYRFTSLVQPVSKNITQILFTNALDLGKVLWNVRYLDSDHSKLLEIQVGETILGIFFLPVLNCRQKIWSQRGTSVTLSCMPSSVIKA